MHKPTLLSLSDNLISGVARVPGARGRKIFFAPHQQKLHSLNWKIGTKVRKSKTKTFTVCYFCCFRSMLKRTRRKLQQ